MRQHRTTKLLSSAIVTAFTLGMLFTAPAQATILVTDDPVLYWNQVMYTGLAGAPPVLSRSAAMVDIAMFDAVNAALGNPYNPYLSGVSASGGDVRAAAAQAAHDVLVYLNPANAAQYDAALVASLALVTDTGARDAGITTGSASAAAMIVSRADDGFATAASTPYTPGTDPGDWQPTGPANLPAALPGYGEVETFLLNSGDQFRPGAPPALNSAEYAAAYNEVMAIGSATSLTRTADQTAAAQFWAGAGGTSWIQIGVELAADEGLSTIQNAQLFAVLGAGLGDAFITVFDAKYEYDLWRPVTAIHNGDLDGNPLTTGDEDWASLLISPNHPDYFSAHAVADGTAGTILLSLLGDESFCATFGALTRCWDSIAAAAQEGADSRIWGGIHFGFDGKIGLKTGQSVGEWALNQRQFQRAVPEPSTWAMMLIGFGAAGFAIRRRRRQAMIQIA